ncbi:hypothetical protein ACFWTC_35455 [Streptomyces sp. NPDC058619]|uniref:hypothetical protein n=1 Tax=Streptomyces sp. NPDC058619 TaxID=3346559 RepID=UPI00364CE06E
MTTPNNLIPGTTSLTKDIETPPRTNPAVTTAPCPPGHRGACVYAIGGTTGGVTGSAVVEAYSVETNAWISLSFVTTARTGAAAATAPCTEGTGLRGSCVYVLGGTDTTGTATAVTEAFAIEPAKPQPQPKPKPQPEAKPKEPTKTQPPLTDGTAPVEPDLLP